MSLSTAEIDQALFDVRRAYRLLHDYQRMALDSVSYIGKQLGMNYVGGWPKFGRASPKEGKGRLNDSAWDWLNMEAYEFHFVRSLPDELKVSILLISDTGYFCSEHEARGEPNTSNFLAPDKSRTEIGFVISGSHYWPSAGPIVGKAGMKHFIESGGGLSAEIEAKGIVGKCFNFSCLVGEEETNRLIEELIAFANRSGIPLKKPDLNA